MGMNTILLSMLDMIYRLHSYIHGYSTETMPRLSWVLEKQARATSTRWRLMAGHASPCALAPGKLLIEKLVLVSDILVLAKLIV